MRGCPNCATEVAEDAVFCRRCGMELTASNVSQSVGTNPPSMLGRPFSVALIVTGLLVCLTAAFLEFTVYAVMIGFAGFAVFIFGGVRYLMHSVQKRPLQDRAATGT